MCTPEEKVNVPGRTSEAEGTPTGKPEQAPLRIPGSAQRRAGGSNTINSLHLNRTCHSICDICLKPRKVGNHETCSRTRQKQGAEARAKAARGS